MRRRSLVALAGLALGRAAAAQPPPPLIAAAADLQAALAEIADHFKRASGHGLRLIFGSSGNLTRQIEQGAPIELFLSADEAYVFRLQAGGHSRDAGRLYAIGRIVLFASPASPLRVEGGIEAIGEALSAGQISRFAIANPEHAPYGRAAREALQAAGLWQAIQRFLVFGENVAQAAQFALLGGSQGGIIAYSLVLSPTLQGRGRYALLPASLHAPLRQRMVLTRRAGAVAERFFAYMSQPPAQTILTRFGFTLPREGEE